MRYFIMNKDKPLVALLATPNEILPFRFLKSVKNVPFDTDDLSINSWIEHRKLPAGRLYLKQILLSLGLLDTFSYINITKAVSLNDTLWIKSEIDNLAWADVSPYSNPLNKVFSDMSLGLKTPLVNLKTSFSPELSTQGMFPKCWVKRGHNLIFVKAGSTAHGLEPFSEFFATQVGKALGLTSLVEYNLTNYKGLLVSYSKAFTSATTGFLPAKQYFRNNNDLLDDLKSYDALGLGREFREMLLFDCIILNTDRHRGNYGVLIDNATFKVTGISPIFDTNLSLLSCLPDNKCQGDYLRRYLDSQTAFETGLRFTELAKLIMTEDLHRRLSSLQDFSLVQHKAIKLSATRFNFISSLLNYQVSSILKHC